MEKFLINNGFKLTSTCSCSGRKQKNFSNERFPKYKVKYFIGTKTFCILKNDLRVTKKDVKEEYAEQIFKEYGLIE